MQQFKELGEMVANAANWYGRRGEQYKGDQLTLYDKAARLLTDREDLGNHIAHNLIGQHGPVLEIAAGSGIISRELAQVVPAEQLTVTDLSQDAMILLREALPPETTVLRADFLDLPFDDQSFQTIVCVGGYRYVSPEQSPQFWAEVDRVLMPGGRIIIAEFHPLIRRMSGLAIDEADIPDNFSIREVETRMTHEQITGVIPSGRYILYSIEKAGGEGETHEDSST